MTQNRAVLHQPKTWPEILGQEDVVAHLLNAIRTGKIAPAYFAAGRSGVGKTSVARLMAAVLLCPNTVDATPCWACETCQSVLEGTCEDLKIVDGPSERSLANVKEKLIPFMHSKPWFHRWKVLIVDEVHKYKDDAISAFLSPLEELPKQGPETVVFFCTTDRYKVPVTIRNRCVPLNFLSLPEEHIIAKILAEYPDLGDGVLEALLEAADGSMRTIYSLLDGLEGTEITEAAVRAQSGTLTKAELAALWRALERRDYVKVRTLWHVYNGRKLDLLAVSEQLLNEMGGRMAAHPEWPGWDGALSAMGFASVYNQKAHWATALFKLLGVPA